MLQSKKIDLSQARLLLRKAYKLAVGSRAGLFDRSAQPDEQVIGL